MNRAFKITEEFDRQWEHMGLNDDDLRRLERELLDNPKAGVVIQGTGRLRKMRFAFEKKGKSGSSRVLYVDFTGHGIIYLITAYPKNEKDDITQKERRLFKQFIDQLEKTLGGENHE
jgi:hypothetical protein